MAHAKTEVALLTYDASKDLLQGTIGTHLPFEMKAFSGGSRGHNAKVSAKEAKLYLHSEANSMWSRFANTKAIGHGTKRDPYKQRGGTLPAGHYSCQYIADHKVFHECIYLKRNADTHIRYQTLTGVDLDNRGDDFYIHGHGKKGSDGCLVPASETERLKLTHAIRDFAKKGGKVVLLVKNVAYVLPAEGDAIGIA